MKGEGKPINYLVLKIGDKVFSTSSSCIPKHKIDLRRPVDSENIWVKGTFTEKKGHKEILPVPFELNIYVSGRRDNE